MFSQLNMLEDNQNLYIIFSSTNTKMGKFIRFFTKYQYNHVSLAFDHNFDKMYSFARYFKNNPLVGGFVEESTLRYFDGNHNQVQVKLCRIPLSGEEYNAIHNYISEIQGNSEQYIYNTFSAILHAIHRNIPIDKSYTCLEFAGEVLNRSCITQNKDFNCVNSIAELDNHLSEFKIYEGDLRRIVQLNSWGNDYYFRKVALFFIWSSTAKHFFKLIYRIIKNSNQGRNQEVTM